MTPSEEFKARRRAKDLQKCRHFNGISIIGDGTIRKREACAAGVPYDSVRAPGKELACFGGDNCTACDKREPFTTAELDAEAVELAARFAKMAKARAAIVKHAGPHKKGAERSGILPCPACGTGELHYRRSGYNGHVHAGCSTEGCVSWME